MKRAQYLFVLMILAGSVICLAANPAVGKWNCVSDDGHGAIRHWTLVIDETKGKLAGAITGLEEGESMPLINPKFDGNLLSFKTFVNPTCTIAFTMKVDGKKLDGKFECPEVSGTLTGIKKSAASVPGQSSYK
jgi:hypothetical protein